MTIQPRRWRTRDGWRTEQEGESALMMARRFRTLWDRLDRAARRGTTIQTGRWRARKGCENVQEGSAALLKARRFRLAGQHLDQEIPRATTIQTGRWRTRKGWESAQEGQSALLTARRGRGAWDWHDKGHRRRRLLRRCWKRGKGALLWGAVAGGCLGWALATSPWPVTVTLKHAMATGNCTSARLAGLAPASRGEPGYREHLDADGDGVSCEWWPPR